MNAIGMLDLGGSSMSFETVLRSAKIDIRLRASLSNQTHQSHVEKGRTRRITGEGFKNSPLT